jgi:DNA-directed DNA polymerase III PolC
MFTHLHCHSYYSFNAGTIPIPDLVQLAKSKGMQSLALTDTNNMSGIIEFYLTAKKEGIKPILGVEIKTRHERAVLLARNNQGYREVCETLTTVLQAIPQIKPKLTLEDLLKEEQVADKLISDEGYRALAPYLINLSENVVILSSSQQVLQSLAAQKKRNLYIELIPTEKGRWDSLKNIYRVHRLPIVASNNVFLKDSNDYELHRVLRAAGTNTTLGNTPLYEMAHQSQSFIDERSLRAALSGIDHSSFTNIDNIADNCNVEFDLSSNKFAHYPCENPNELLRQLADAGFKWRYKKPTAQHIARYEYELDTIQRLDATSYFLCTHDMIEFAKRQGFPFIGRGSGANSLIAYCLDISNVDPIEHDLKFERFLNPERESPPDFDIDFSWKDRYVVINYLLDKYGRDRSAMLCTIQSYRTKGGLRQVGKSLGYSDTEIAEQFDSIQAAYLTQNENRTIAEKASEDAKLQDKRAWLSWSNRLQGFPSHLSIHAGGVLMVDQPIANFTPIQQAPSEIPITHIDMNSAEDLRFPKLDVLATRGLGTYWDSLALIEKRYGSRAAVEKDVTIAFNDQHTTDLITSGRTIGIFYAESPASIGCIRKMRVDTFPLLYQALSVIRPGVATSGMMSEFIGRLRNSEMLKNAIPALLEILPETFGVMLFQEDVLEIAHRFAGLSYGKADLLRRAMSGKLRSAERMSQLEGDFIQGALANGHSLDVAKEVWRQVSSFAGYAFSKAHSASYSVLSYKQAWLKTHYPAEFMCSVLNNYGGYYRQQVYVDEAKSLGVRFKVPDVNVSLKEHTVLNDHEIQLGFDAFKELSARSVENLLINRERGGTYTSVEDFAIRSGVTQEDGILLISLGACDSLEVNRSSAAMRFALIAKQKQDAQQYSLDFPVEALPYDFSHLIEPDSLSIFDRERKTFSYSVTNHPSDFLKGYEDKNTIKSSELARFSGRQITIVGSYSSSKRTSTRKGKPMLMLNVSDERGMMDVVVWNDVFNQYYTELTNGAAFKIIGKVEVNYDVPSIHAQKIERIEFF